MPNRVLSMAHQRWAALGIVAILLLVSSLFPPMAAAVPPDPEPQCEAATTAPDRDPDIEWLMVQEAQSGSFVPDGKGGYVLTLSGASPSTIYFSNRPASLAGSVSTALFMEKMPLWKEGQAPPNAAIVLNDEAASQDTIIVQLMDPKYDAEAATLVYSTKVVPDYDGEKLAYHQGRADKSIPQKFGQASLFIDHAQCWSTYTQCYNGWWCCNDPVAPLHDCGGVHIDQCWSWSHLWCEPCTDIRTTCHNAYPSCCQDCYKGCQTTGCPNPP